MRTILMPSGATLCGTGILPARMTGWKLVPHNANPLPRKTWTILLDVLVSMLIYLALSAQASATTIQIVVPSTADTRIQHGVDKLRAALQSAQYDPRVTNEQTPNLAASTIQVGTINDGAAFKNALNDKKHTPESYVLRGGADNGVVVAGFDSAGTMYGCLDLAGRIAASRRIPKHLNVIESPTMSLRGTCILLMKLGLYDYPVTPKEFPFFYDKNLWTEYLDFLADNRFNYIAFWNGHPFDYFVKLDKYPEAQSSLGEELLTRNHDMLMWLGGEAQKRNIWLMFEFYNIHTSVDFAKAHNLPPHGISEPTPLLRDYTSYCIERFVNEFPSVGLYICPGEMLRLKYVPDWINEVIFAAVKKTGKNPPIMIRSWGIDLPNMRKVAGHYSPLYTERKFNVEMIADTRIDPENRDWASITGNHVVNIHCVGNLEPFRWNPPSYIQTCVQNSVKAGGTGLHLYPRKAWRWPYGCDKGADQELQWHRDRLWFETWGRYAWNPNRNAPDERKHWITRLTEIYGNEAAAEKLLDSFESGADVLPALQRLVWLGNDNHTIIAAGILLDQIQQAKGIPFLSIEAERIPDYITGMTKGKAQASISPVDFLAGKVSEANKALEAARAGAAAATRNREEAERIATDAEAVAYVVRFYHHKLKAGIADALQAAGIDKQANTAACLNNLRASLEDFRSLTMLTSKTYESLSDVPAWNPTRKLPCPFHWSDVLPFLEMEAEKIEKGEESTMTKPSM